MPAFQITKVEHMNRNFHLHDTMAILKWLLQLFSLNSAEKRIHKSEKFWYIFKCVISVITFAALNIYAFIWKKTNIFPSINPSIIITDVIQMTYDYFQYIVDLFYIYKYGREVSQEYFKNYNCIDKILDTTHKVEIKERILKLSVIFMLLWLITSAVDFTAWYISFGILTPLVYGLAYIFLLIKTLTNLDLTVQIINVECRLRVLGDLLQDAYNSIDQLPIGHAKDEIRDALCNKNWLYGKECDRANKMRSRNHPLKYTPQRVHEMKWLTRCYLLLNEQCMFINSMYGVRILLNSLSLLIDMVRFLNVAVRISIGSQKTAFDSGYLPAISSLMRFGMCVVILTSLVYHCENAYAQRERIVRISDHILINKKPDESLRTSVTELRSLVSSRPICFNMANFFKLSYPFLVSMSSVVVTYTIILLQSL